MRQTIKTTIAEAVGEDAQVYLFGSRVDDSKRGGDVDLLILTEIAIPLLQRADIKRRLEQSLNLPFDVLSDKINSPNRNFVEMILPSAFAL